MLKLLNIGFIFFNSLGLFVHINLFSAGFVGTALSKNKNLLVVLMSIELMFLGLGLGFAAHGTTGIDPSGQVFALLLLGVSAAESAVGLGLIVAAFKTRGHIN